jgi:hypothetical protein
MNVHALIQRRSLGAILALVLTPLLAVASTDNGTLTAGTSVAGLCSGHPIILHGYISGGIGSYSPTGLTGGQTVSDVYDQENTPPCVPAAVSVSVSGFSSDPGSSWLTSITCDGVEKTTHTAYLYSAGVATWNYSGVFGLVSGNYSCSIVHS